MEGQAVVHFVADDSRADFRRALKLAVSTKRRSKINHEILAFLAVDKPG